MLVATKFNTVAAQRPCRRPNLALKGPTSNDERKVPIVMSEEISCWTVYYTQDKSVSQCSSVSGGLRAAAAGHGMTEQREE
jgi:hypothetical protein